MTTATVETLTAEVRVLMVGNRQITLSVARQLDRIPAERIEPFGRCRIGTDGSESMIGKDPLTGALAITAMPQPEWRTIIDGAEWRQAVIVCTKAIPDLAINQSGDLTMRLWGHQFLFMRRTWRRCTEAHQGDERCPAQINIPAADGYECLHDIATDQGIERRLHEEFQRLPLIVLAGLR